MLVDCFVFQGSREEKKKKERKQILYHRSHSTRSTLFGMAGQPILCENPNHPCKPLNVICEGQIFLETENTTSKTMDVSFQVQPSY